MLLASTSPRKSSFCPSFFHHHLTLSPHPPPPSSHPTICDSNFSLPQSHNYHHHRLPLCCTTTISHLLHAMHHHRSPPLSHKVLACTQPPPACDLHLWGSVSTTLLHYHYVVVHIHCYALLYHNEIAFLRGYLIVWNCDFIEDIFLLQQNCVSIVYIFSLPLNSTKSPFHWRFFLSRFHCDKNISLMKL